MPLFLVHPLRQQKECQFSSNGYRAMVNAAIAICQLSVPEWIQTQTDNFKIEERPPTFLLSSIMGKLLPSRCASSLGSSGIVQLLL